MTDRFRVGPTPAPAPSPPRLRTLAIVESRRYARHPLFLVGFALLVWITYLTLRDLRAATPDGDVVDASFMPRSAWACWALVGHQLSRSMHRSDDVLAAAPCDGVPWAVRCSACSSPAGRPSRAPGWSPRRGPRRMEPGRDGWPGDVTVPSRDAPAAPCPYASWVSSDGQYAPSWVAGGAPQWYLVYLTLLCCLGATAALYRQVAPSQRTLLRRIALPVAVLAVAALALAAAPDPTRIPCDRYSGARPRPCSGA